MRVALLVILFLGVGSTAPDTDASLRSLVQQAQRAEQQNRLSDAVALYTKVLKIRPNWASAELNLGLVYHSLGDCSSAIRVLSNALRHQPDLHSALLFRGACYQQSDRPEDAIRDLTAYLAR